MNVRSLRSLLFFIIRDFAKLTLLAAINKKARLQRDKFGFSGEGGIRTILYNPRLYCISMENRI